MECPIRHGSLAALIYDTSELFCDENIVAGDDIVATTSAVFILHDAEFA
jgi:hypothetical protein